MQCACGKQAEAGSDTCFRCRVATVAIGTRGPAVQGKFHTTKKEWMQEHLGTADDRELGKQGIERVSS